MSLISLISVKISVIHGSTCVRSSTILHSANEGQVLTHCRKTAPFCIVDILIPSPCLLPPLPPEINVEFWTLKAFYFT